MIGRIDKKSYGDTRFVKVEILEDNTVLSITRKGSGIRDDHDHTEKITLTADETKELISYLMDAIDIDEIRIKKPNDAD
jgi:predicted transcriptional regulator